MPPVMGAAMMTPMMAARHVRRLIVPVMVLPIMVLPWLIMPIPAVLVVMAMARAVLGHRPVNMLGHDDDARSLHITGWWGAVIIGFVVNRTPPTDQHLKISTGNGCA